MEYLLFGGAESVGKTTAIFNTAQYLLLPQNRFKVISGGVPKQLADFKAVLEGNDNTGKKVIIIINSATDTEKKVKEFKNFYDQNGSYDILISSIRDENFKPRAKFFQIFAINPASPNILEIPLGKTRGGLGRTIALSWYAATINKLVIHTLSNPPYNI